MHSQGNKKVLIEKAESPENKLKDIEIRDLNDREFKIAILEKLIEIQENSDRHFNELRNKIDEQRKHFTKEAEMLKREPSGIIISSRRNDSF